MRTYRLLKLLFPAIAFLWPVAAGAQVNTEFKYPYGIARTCDDLVNKPPSSVSVEERKKTARECLNLSQENITEFLLFAGGKGAYHRLLQAVENARLDKQAGTSPSAEGTTSTVSKGAVSQILSLAVEQGALTRTDNKSLATFRGNALGVARLFTGDEQFPYCAIFDYGCESSLAGFFRRTSFSFSIDTQPANGQLPTATNPDSNKAVLTAGHAQQIPAWGFRYDFNVRRQKFGKEFLAKIKTVSDSDYFKKVVEAVTKIAQTDAYGKWFRQYETLLASNQVTTETALRDLLGKAVTDLVEVAKNLPQEPDKPSFQSSLNPIIDAMGDYFGRRDKALEAIVNPWTFSLEYNDDRPQNQPSQSSLKFIASGRDAAGNLQFTFNASAARYDHKPAQGAVKQFRDAQASLQLDRALTAADARYGATLSIGYYFQYMADDALLTIPSGNLAPGTSIALPGDASVLLKTKGSIHIAQVGVTFRIRDTGVKVPLTVSYSNRTELIKANNMRGHFGVSYDLDSLFAGR
jgi:hypothetical protein